MSLFINIFVSYFFIIQIFIVSFRIEIRKRIYICTDPLFIWFYFCFCTNFFISYGQYLGIFIELHFFRRSVFGVSFGDLGFFDYLFPKFRRACIEIIAIFLLICLQCRRYLFEWSSSSGSHNLRIEIYREYLCIIKGDILSQCRKIKWLLWLYLFIFAYGFDTIG